MSFYSVVQSVPFILLFYCFVNLQFFFKFQFNLFYIHFILWNYIIMVNKIYILCVLFVFFFLDLLILLNNYLKILLLHGNSSFYGLFKLSHLVNLPSHPIYIPNLSSVPSLFLSFPLSATIPLAAFPTARKYRTLVTTVCSLNKHLN